MSDGIDIWMPLYIRDYLADTSRLTTEQHGAYLLLIMDYWMRGAFPDDDEILQRITKMSAESWATSGRVLRAMFIKGVDGRLFHKRIEQELEKARASKQVAVSRAKKAAQSRWNDNASSNAPSNASSIPESPDLPEQPMLGAMLEDMLEQCPSPSPSHKDVVTQSASVTKGNSVAEDTSAPRSKKPERNAGASPLGFLPCVGGKRWQFSQADVDEWRRTYTAVDVMQELRKMKQWLKANPRKVKTQRGTPKFVINWLGNAQDRGPRGAEPKPVRGFMKDIEESLR